MGNYNNDIVADRSVDRSATTDGAVGVKDVSGTDLSIAWRLGRRRACGAGLSLPTRLFVPAGDQSLMYGLCWTPAGLSIASRVERV